MSTAARTRDNRAADAFAAALALSVVLPPKYLTIYIILLAGLSAIWGLMRRRTLILSRPALPILLLLFAAAIFSLAGTLPVTKQSDIQLEFLKYSIYAGAFGIGLIVANTPRRSQLFVLSTIMVLLGFFLATYLLTPPGTPFHINQSWPLYPPDQNNSSSILVPMAAIVLTVQTRWLRIALLTAIFLFVSAVESRLGIILMYGVVAAHFVVDWRGGVILALIVLGFSFAPQLPVLQSPPIPGSFQTEKSGQLPSAQLPGASKGFSPALPSAEVEFGTSSDYARIAIYKRALAISADVFPNLLGMGDKEVIKRLNTPRIDNKNIYQHAHNFFLQSYLAYGLLATLSFIAAAAGILWVAVSRRNWYLFGALVLLGIFGMIESLVSDVRVLAVLMLGAGSFIAVTIQKKRELFGE